MAAFTNYVIHYAHLLNRLQYKQFMDEFQKIINQVEYNGVKSDFLTTFFLRFLVTMNNWSKLEQVDILSRNSKCWNYRKRECMKREFWIYQIKSKICNKITEHFLPNSMDWQINTIRRYIIIYIYIFHTTSFFTHKLQIDTQIYNEEVYILGSTGSY